MYLKRLEMQGFKSFPDKITLDFTPGMTAVVGPNGSGKSNVSDAIRWVLGEQSVKYLRGSKMEDVIFAGTQHRKALGFAEVSLTIDNRDHALEVEFSEVTVTRRVFRSGESEYFINKAACRLKDIHELFMDTGLGRDGYSIVGQGKIDEILSNKSEDRRQVFEEAAGISKYKYRKQEAERKLFHTEENITRLADIIHELSERIGPLQEQSERAKTYLDLREKLKGLEVSVSVANIDLLKESLGKVTAEFQTAEGQLNGVKQLLDEMDGAIAALYESVSKTEEEIGTAREVLIGTEAQIQNHLNEIGLFQNTIQHNENTCTRLQQEIEEMAALGQEHAHQIEDKQADIEDMIGQVAEKHKQTEESSVIFGQKEQLFQIKNQAVRQVQEEGRMGQERLAELRASLSGASALQQNYQERLQQAQEQETHKKQEWEQVREQAQHLEEQAKEWQQKADGCEEQQQNALQRVEELRGKLGDLEEQAQKTVLQYRQKTDRMHLLAELERDMEGYQKGVKAVLQAKKEEIAGVQLCGTLGQLITVQKPYVLAIETALGSALQNIVTETEQDAKAAIAYLKKNKLGRVTFLPLSTVRGRRLEQKIQQEPGFIGLGTELVETDSKYQEIVASLLGNLAVVDTIDHGISLAKKFSYRFRIVTLEGDLFLPGGSMSGGFAGQRTGILSRSAEQKALEQETAQLKEQMEKQAQEVASLASMVAQAEEEAAILQQQGASLRETLIGMAAEHRHYTEREKQLQQEQEALQQECLAVQNRLQDMCRQTEEKEQERKQLEQQAVQTEQRLHEAQEAAEDAARERQAAQEMLNGFKLDLLDANKNIEIEQERLRVLQAQMAYDQQAMDGKRLQIEELRSKNEDIADDISFKHEQIAQLREEVQRGKTALQEMEQRKKQAQDSILEKQNDSKNRREELLLLQQEHSRLEHKREKAEGEMDAILSRLWEEYNLTYSTARPYVVEFGSISKAQKQIQSYKGEMAALGNINIDAIEEYKQVSERYAFLTGQQQDLLEAKDSLEKLIRQMRDLMKTIFTERFGVINQHFKEIFAELFGGGHAELRLSEPNDVLESGIDIDVQPPGKKLQNLMLLSGGEKALCAIALLFAILKTRPAPFCIFDEIEAALDDVNVYRFAEYLRSINDKTQFVVITHRRGTMEAADRLYGVTMQQKGISRLLELNMAEEG